MHLEMVQKSTGESAFSFKNGTFLIFFHGFLFRSSQNHIRRVWGADLPRWLLSGPDQGGKSAR